MSYKGGHAGQFQRGLRIYQRQPDWDGEPDERSTGETCFCLCWVSTKGEAEEHETVIVRMCVIDPQKRRKRVRSMIVSNEQPYGTTQTRVSAAQTRRRGIASSNAGDLRRTNTTPGHHDAGDVTGTFLSVKTRRRGQYFMPRRVDRNDSLPHSQKQRNCKTSTLVPSSHETTSCRSTLASNKRTRRKMASHVAQTIRP